jgi:hypothetical protein
MRVTHLAHIILYLTILTSVKESKIKYFIQNFPTEDEEYKFNNLRVRHFIGEIHTVAAKRKRRMA